MAGTISCVYSTHSACQWTCLAELADSKPPRAFAARACGAFCKVAISIRCYCGLPCLP